MKLRNFNFIYLHQYFVTPKEYGGTRSYWFARKLIERGHLVKVISALSSSTVSEVGNYEIDGIKVIYVGGRYSNLHSKFRKLLHFTHYFFAGTLKLLNQKKPDIIYATSTPLTVGAIALIAKKVKGIPYVFEVRDLWPEFPIQIRAIKNPLFIKLLRLLEKSIYKNAEHIVALSPGMRDGILNTGVAPNKVTVIPNMSKPDIFYPREKSIELMKTYNLYPDKFNVIHFGAMAPANALEYVILAAMILKEKNINNICFIFAGYGASESKLKRLARDYELDNVLFTGKHNALTISELVNCCDASLVSFRNLPILSTNSPNKLFDSLSAGKPLIVNSSGWTKELVEVNNCGFYVNPDQPEDFVEKLISFSSNKELLRQMGENARRLSIEMFDKEILAKQFAELLEDIVHNKSTGQRHVL